MPHCRNDGGLAFEDGSRHFFFVKGPQIFHGSSAAAHDHHIHAILIQHADSPDNAVRRLLPLHQCRIQNQLHVWISTPGNIHNVPDGRPRRRRHNTDDPAVERNGLLELRGKHAHLFQFLFQQLKLTVKVSLSVRYNLPGIQLVSAVPLIDADRSQDNDFLAFLHPEGKSRSPVSRKHDTGDGAALILQGKINMSGRVVFTVGYLALHINPVQHEILGEHIFNIPVDLGHRIYIFCHVRLLSSYVCQNSVYKCRGLVSAIFLCQFHCLVDGYFLRNILVKFHFIDS